MNCAEAHLQIYYAVSGHVQPLLVEVVTDPGSITISESAEQCLVKFEGLGRTLLSTGYT